MPITYVSVAELAIKWLWLCVIVGVSAGVSVAHRYRKGCHCDYITTTRGIEGLQSFNSLQHPRTSTWSGSQCGPFPWTVQWKNNLYISIADFAPAAFIKSKQHYIHLNLQDVSLFANSPWKSTFLPEVKLCLSGVGDLTWPLRRGSVTRCKTVTETAAVVRLNCCSHRVERCLLAGRLLDSPGLVPIGGLSVTENKGSSIWQLRHHWWHSKS